MNKNLEKLTQDNVYGGVYEMILTDGRPEDPVSVTKIRQWFGLSDGQVRRIVNKLREAGALIVGDEFGYWIARTDEEIQAWIRWYLAPCSARYKIVRAMTGIIPGQMEF